MHDCVMRRSAGGTGKVFENVGVIDYHEIMDKLIASASDETLIRNLWLEDGFHPAKEPGRLYLNEIFRLLGVPPLERSETRRSARAEDGDDLQTGGAEEDRLKI